MTIGEKCTVSNCGNRSIARDLCAKHYKRLQRHGDPLREVSDRGCRDSHPLYTRWNWLMRRYAIKGLVSEEWKDLWNFVRDVGGEKKDGYGLARIDDAKPFSKDNFFWRKRDVVRGSPEEREQKRIYAIKWRKANPGKAQASQLKRHYGLTLETYELMHTIQGGVCAICKSPEKSVDPKTKKVRKLAVDHCHFSNKVRALLCNECNGALGRFKDSTTLLQAAIEYLKRHQS